MSLSTSVSSSNDHHPGCRSPASADRGGSKMKFTLRGKSTCRSLAFVASAAVAALTLAACGGSTGGSQSGGSQSGGSAGSATSGTVDWWGWTPTDTATAKGY